MGCVIGNRKVAVIGAGCVGSSIAFALALRDAAQEIVLIDVDREKCRGEALDIRQCLPGAGIAEVYAGDYRDCADCDLIIVTAGRNRNPGESRLDMAGENVRTMRTVADSVSRYYTRGCLLIISNPVDILTFKFDEWMGLSDGAVFGSGCVLDTSRFLCCAADYLGTDAGEISGYLVGEHGESQVPVWSRVTVGGILIEEYCRKAGLPWNSDIREEIAFKTRTMGTEIIRAKGTTHYGIAACVCQIAEAVLRQRPVILPVTSTLTGEYGCRKAALSVPSLVGPAGVQQRICEKWTAEEYRGFSEAAEKMKGILRRL